MVVVEKQEVLLCKVELSIKMVTKAYIKCNLFTTLEYRRHSKVGSSILVEGIFLLALSTINRAMRQCGMAFELVATIALITKLRPSRVYEVKCSLKK